MTSPLPPTRCSSTSTGARRGLEAGDSGRSLARGSRHGRESEAALVLSVPTDDVDRSLVTLVPHTTALRQSRFEAVVPAPFLKPGAFDAQGIVTVPTIRLIRPLGALSGGQLAPVEKAVLRWLGFKESGT